MSVDLSRACPDDDLHNREELMTNQQLSTRDSLISEYSDTYKEAYGYRPSLAGMQEMALEELEAIVKRVSRAAEQAYQEEKARMSGREVQVKEEIAKLLPMAGTLEDVIRWMHQAEDTDGDDGYLEYKLGVNYGFLAKLRAA